jgi:hypothetical protein
MHVVGLWSRDFYAASEEEEGGGWGTDAVDRGGGGGAVVEEEGEEEAGARPVTPEVLFCLRREAKKLCWRARAKEEGRTKKKEEEKQKRKQGQDLRESSFDWTRDLGERGGAEPQGLRGREKQGENEDERELPC